MQQGARNCSSPCQLSSSWTDGGARDYPEGSGEEHIHGIVLQASQPLCQYRFRWAEVAMVFQLEMVRLVDKAARMESMKEDPAFPMRL